MSFRVSVDLRRVFSDERSRVWMLVPAGSGSGSDGENGATVGWLARRLARWLHVPRGSALALLADGHLLPDQEALQVLQPGDKLCAVPYKVKLKTELKSTESANNVTDIEDEHIILNMNQEKSKTVDLTNNCDIMRIENEHDNSMIDKHVNSTNGFDTFNSNKSNKFDRFVYEMSNRMEDKHERNGTDRIAKEQADDGDAEDLDVVRDASEHNDNDLHSAGIDEDREIIDKSVISTECEWEAKRRRLTESSEAAAAPVTVPMVQLAAGPGEAEREGAEEALRGVKQRALRLLEHLNLSAAPAPAPVPAIASRRRRRVRRRRPASDAPPVLPAPAASPAAPAPAQDPVHRSGESPPVSPVQPVPPVPPVPPPQPRLGRLVPASPRATPHHITFL